MLAILPLILLFAILYVVLRPVTSYLLDVKGFRKYPTQNWLSGFSNLAYCWEVARKNRSFHTRRLHEAHAKDPVIRIGPNWLSFSSPSAVKDIYGYNSPCRKAAIYDALSGGGRHLVNISDKHKHSSRRRMVAASYAPKNIEMWEFAVADSMTKLLKQMDGMCTAPLLPSQVVSLSELKFDGMHWSNLFAFEVVIKIGMSKDMHFIEAGNDLIQVPGRDGEPKTINAIQSLHGGSRAASTLVWDTERFELYTKISQAMSKWYTKNLQGGADWRAFIIQITLERIEKFQNGEVLDDLFQPMVIDKQGEEPAIHHQDRIAEVDQMINGGGDGPAISLCNTLYYLAQKPSTLSRLRAELDAALLPTDTVAPWAKVRSLEYLRACLDESMRLSPPVATDLLRKTPPAGLKVDMEIVPGNTTVSVAAYTAHRDPLLFPDPEAFRPERWLVRGQNRLKEMRAAFIPFSAGTRACIGRNVTIVMQTVFLASLVHRYDFALAHSGWEMEWEEYFNLWPVELPLKIWRVK